MRKDPTEFRKRFAAWQDGKMPYKDGRAVLWQEDTDYGVPFIESKRVKLTNAGYSTGAVLSTNMLDSIADNAVKAGLPVRTALGLAVKESTLGNPTDDRSARTLLSTENKAKWANAGYGQHINEYGDYVSSRELINWWKDQDDKRYGKNGRSVLEGGFEFYKNNPHGYNPGQRNHPQLVEKRAKELMGSPLIQLWQKDRSLKLTLQLKKNFGKHWLRPYEDGKMPKYEIGKITRVYKPYLDTDGTIVRNVAAELPEITITNDIHHKDWSNHNRKNAVITADTRDRDYVKQQRAQREFNALVDKAKSDYAMSNFLLSTSNIRPVNGKYLPGLGELAGWETVGAVASGLDPFAQIPFKKIIKPFTKLLNSKKGFIITEKTADKITPQQWDNAYITAVNNGNMEEAQRLRDLHFKTKARWSKAVDESDMPIKQYHTVLNAYPAEFNEFNPAIEGTHSSIYTSDSPIMSGTYTSKITSDFEREYYINAAIDNMKQQIKNGYVTGADAAKIKNALKSHEASVEYVMEKLPWLNTRVAPERQKILYANIKRPIIIDAGGASWNNLPINQLPLDVYDALKASGMNGYTTRDIERAQQITKNYDGAIIKNVMDYGGSWKSTVGEMTPNTVYQINNPKMLKYADMITYDDYGKIIPLSKRDNFNIKDLRYAVLPFVGGSLYNSYK